MASSSNSKQRLLPAAIRRPMLALALATSPSIFLVAYVNAEEARRWMGEAQEGGAVLLYGLPQTDDVPVSFRCELPAREFIMTLSLDPNFEPKTGAVKLTVNAPPAADQLVVDAEIQFLEEMELTFLEARPAFDAAIARMLKQGTELKFTINEKTFAYPLTGAAEAMGPIEAACAKPT
ncbi:hypothetical protein SAMN05880561_103378 [Rhizobium sp. RU33A]|uniref:hypothetical protein n=1 Tax=Rhizobium sp. RU33A TaxID=1907413 RepID=UPI0009563F4D|nr:hypothetical protein [Rhizobium sp. RU33A]SIQ52729.1 hypothetical protein SAMN05880561_103378 [Rhizobium sp. RU33A]